MFTSRAFLKSCEPSELNENPLVLVTAAGPDATLPPFPPLRVGDLFPDEGFSEEDCPGTVSCLTCSGGNQGVVNPIARALHMFTNN